jgi:hypothetical protein
MQERESRTMADIFCNCCGAIYDSHVRVCPRCRRCPLCGAVVQDGAEHCTTFDHAYVDAKMAGLEKQLDPALPANQKTIRWLERAWENEQQYLRVMQRLNFWKVIALTILVSPILTFASIGLCWAIGLDDWSPLGLGLLLFLLAFHVVLPRLLQQGYLHWLLRPETSEHTSGK